MLKDFYSEWLWFSNLGYGGVYTTILKTKILIFILAVLIFSLLFVGNLLLTRHLKPAGEKYLGPVIILQHLQQIPRWGIYVGIGFLSLIFGLVAQGNWETILRFFHQQPFGITDPVFHQGVSFYVFSLPFLNFLQSWFLGALIVTLLVVVGIYFLSYKLQRLHNIPQLVIFHVAGIGIAILGLIAWKYWLDIWELVFSNRGAIFGATYADIHAQLPAQWILMAVVILCIGILIAAVLRRKPRWLIYGIGGWIVASIIVGAIFPGFVQRFQVEPNEYSLETPYIEYNIQATRDAFGLSNIDEGAFPAEKVPSSQDIAENNATIRNIRLWDSRPLKDTYNQIQAIRLYYSFHDIDVDRYMIDGKYTQVMLSARELSAEQLSAQAQTWVNRRLQFTHGYGLALSTANEVGAEGLPVLHVKNIPPIGDFDIECPQIYYGEKTNYYVIVNTNTPEFDYPMGETNVYGHYSGEGGVNIGSFMRRVIYAWQFGDINILISGELSPQSRILYYRNISDRVQHLTPFLTLDQDPYLVISDGQLYWIQDAYTTSNRYPYSEPIDSGINYIRNSVKIVINAYDGTTTYYIADPSDALIQTYQDIFPNLFASIDQMPEALRVHLRYPEDLFTVQASVYQTYHMRDSQVFYNKEDLWTKPKEIYAGTQQVMEPYYIIMRLPDENQEEFLLMLPFTPVNKDNTIAWMAARCDGDNLGKLLAYHFPKEHLVYGPSQIENRIQQDTTITEQLALWSRGGSQVIRGNLLLIPIAESNLYVEPVFLQAEAGGLPELKRIIVAAGDQIVMRATLQESITAIFGEEALSLPETPDEEQTNPDIADLIVQAQNHYYKAQQYLEAGNWSGYGNELDALEQILNQLANLIAEEEEG